MQKNWINFRTSYFSLNVKHTGLCQDSYVDINIVFYHSRDFLLQQISNHLYCGVAVDQIVLELKTAMFIVEATLRWILYQIYKLRMCILHLGWGRNLKSCNLYFYRHWLTTLHHSCALCMAYTLLKKSCGPNPTQGEIMKWPSLLVLTESNNIVHGKGSGLQES